MSLPLAVAIVIPVHDEEDLLDECLRSVTAAREALRPLGIPSCTWVVLDRCRDRSAEIAARHDVRTISLQASRVGAARAAGVRAALDAFAHLPLARLWTAHTDADSVVPPHWLTHQARLAARRADVVVGTVRPDFGDLTAAQQAAWTERHTPGVANGHVHGANLGMRASTLVAAGGFADIGEHEDVGLVDAARVAGARIVASDVAWVRTSGRTVGRTDGGYARYLREDLVPAASRSETQRSG